MSVKRVSTLIVLLTMAAILVTGIVVLFDLRFEGGDNYPPCSTLRADPLGARALFDSLRAIPELDVSRNLRPLCDLKEGAGATLFYLGVEAGDLRWFSGDDSRHMEEFLLDGGRVVMTLAPESTDPQRRYGASWNSNAPTTSTRSTTSTLSTGSTSSTTTLKKTDAPTSLPAVYPPPRSMRKAEAEEAERLEREEEEKERRAQAAPT